MPRELFAERFREKRKLSGLTQDKIAARDSETRSIALRANRIAWIATAIAIAAIAIPIIIAYVTAKP